MKRWWLIIFFSVLAFAQNCKVEDLTYNLDRNLELKIVVNKECKGLKVDFDYSKKKYSLYVNFESKIVNGAPPAGFSIKPPNGAFVSLGVDRNIIYRDDNISLQENSKISELKSNILIDLKLKVKNLKSLNSIKTDGFLLTKMSNENCKLVYKNYLLRDYNKAIYPYSKFKEFCKDKFTIIDNNSKLISFFNLSKKDIKKIKKSRGESLFFGFSKRKKSSKKMCNVHITLLDSDFKRVKGEYKYYVEKLNKESFNHTFSSSSFTLPRGVYLVRALANRSYGTNTFICNGGDYDVKIILQSGI